MIWTKNTLATTIIITVHPQSNLIGVNAMASCIVVDKAPET